MSVLSIAGHTPADATEEERTSAPKRVAVGQRISNALEDFLTGFTPGDFKVKLDWDLLSPVASTLSAVATLVIALRGYI